jgi:hypothetical protein
MSADRDRGIRRQKQKRAKHRRKQARQQRAGVERGSKESLAGQKTE